LNAGDLDGTSQRAQRERATSERRRQRKEPTCIWRPAAGRAGPTSSRDGRHHNVEINTGMRRPRLQRQSISAGPPAAFAVTDRRRRRRPVEFIAKSSSSAAAADPRSLPPAPQTSGEQGKNGRSMLLNYFNNRTEMLAVNDDVSTSDLRQSPGLTSGF